jgi:hypothetical protein
MSAIPNTFDSSERIVRVLYFPKLVTKDGKSIRALAFKSPKELDEVSVIRLEYSNPNFCKTHGKKHQVPSDDRAYFGLAVIKVDEIKASNADIVYSPDLPDNPAHSDIKIGFVCEKGKELPAEYSYIVGQLTKKARMFQDPDVSTETWDGAVLK